MKKYDNCGIYIIKNKINGKFYVGSASNVTRRWQGHKYTLNRNINPCTRLQNAWNKYGENNFEFILLEKIEFTTNNKEEIKIILEEREQLYLDSLDAVNKDKGYNVCPVAGSSLGRRSKSATKTKEELLLIASENKPKPNRQRKSLMRSLYAYTNSKNGSYDEEFTKQIKELRLDWFVDHCKEKKEKLLNLALSGDKRPNCRYLLSYINKWSKCYDKEFTEKIKKINPNWLIKSSDENKKKLLQMAVNKEQKPNLKNNKTLARALKSYTEKNGGSYDEEFVKQIKNTAPQWFYKCQIKCVETGQIFESMAAVDRLIKCNTDTLAKAIKTNKLYKNYHWEKIY